MKFLVLFPSIKRGGAEEYALTIASAAVKEGWDVHAAFPQTDLTSSLINDFTANGIQYHRLMIGELNKINLHKIKHFLQLTQTVALLHMIKPDVVEIVLPWSTYCFGNIIACGLMRIPTAVVFQLSPIRLSFNTKMLKIYSWARSRNQEWIAISENNRKIISASFNIPISDVIRIYNGVKAPIFSNTLDNEERTKLRRQTRQELGLPEISKIAITVGRLHPQKGYSDLIPLIPHILREFPNMRFVWVGDGEQKDFLIDKVREYNIEDRVLFIGYRSDVSTLLKSSDIFIFPTHFEGGQSLALVEAMASGLQIVATKASGIPEAIEDKVHGLLCRVGDSCDLLENIRWALRHPEDMQTMARRSAIRAQDFSEDKMVRETFNVLKKLGSSK